MNIKYILIEDSKYCSIIKILPNKQYKWDYFGDDIWHKYTDKQIYNYSKIIRNTFYSYSKIKFPIIKAYYSFDNVLIDYPALMLL